MAVGRIKCGGKGRRGRNQGQEQKQGRPGRRWWLRLRPRDRDRSGKKMSDLDTFQRKS